MTGSRKNNWRTMPSLAYGGWHNSGSYSLWYVTYTVLQFLFSAALCVLRWAAHFLGAGGDWRWTKEDCSCASLFCSSWLAWPIGLATLDAVGETCWLTFPCYSWAYAVLLSKEKKAVCNVLYRFLDQLIQTACLKLLRKICYSIPLLSSTNASAIGSLSFIYLKVSTCSTILLPAVGKYTKELS